MAEHLPGIKNPTELPSGRREFLQQLAAGAAVAAGVQAGLRTARADGGAAGAAPAVAPGRLPRIRLGRHELTRLIVGANPVEGYSHSSAALSRHMKEYFTPERTLEFIGRCEQMGINTWQTGHGPSDLTLQTLKALRERGSKINWLCLSYESPRIKPIRETLAYGPVALVHHGGETDAMFQRGEHEKVHDFIKKVHDAGVMAGVSSHNPANIAYIEEKGWENDFFMTCFYHISRPADQIRKKLGTVPLDEFFLESDRDEMTAVIQQVKRPCLAFKILAAGRLCGSPAGVESCFQYAFSRIKPTDGVIVGIYPRFADEIGINVQHTLTYGTPA